jgi:hypothetical protein
MAGNMLLTLLFSSLANVIFFPVFKHLPLQRGRALGRLSMALLKSAPSRKLIFHGTSPRLATSRASKLAPLPGHFFINGKHKDKAESETAFFFVFSGHGKRVIINIFSE